MSSVQTDAEPTQEPKLWYVVRTNIKCEKRALAALTGAGYEAYLPLMRRDVVHHRTKKVVTKEFVLFNRYLFVAQPAEGADWFRLRRCDGVEAVLGSGGRYLPVDARTVAAYVSVGKEPGTRALLDALRSAGKRVLLPLLLPDNDLDWAAYEGPGSLAEAAHPG